MAGSKVKTRGGKPASVAGIKGQKWLGMEGSNLRFLIQSQASYHWTNPQNWRGGAGISSGSAAAGKGNRPAISNMIIPAGRFVKGYRLLSAEQLHNRNCLSRP